VAFSWGSSIEQGDNGAALMTRVAMRIHGIIPARFGDLGEYASLWPLKHSGLSGYMVYLDFEIRLLYF
jgi:hypothetical protein